LLKIIDFYRIFSLTIQNVLRYVYMYYIKVD